MLVSFTHETLCRLSPPTSPVPCHWMGDHVDAHKFSSRHRHQIESSTECSCFYCLRIFSPQDITQWWEESKKSGLGQSATAVCPHCGIDVVIGSASGYPITQAFLEKMQGHWFSYSAEIDHEE